MSIYEAIGIGFVILMTCIGTAVVGTVLWEGIQRVSGRLAIGTQTEDAAVRDFLAVKDQIGAAK